MSDDPRNWLTTKSDLLERAVLERLLASTDGTRVLEVGVGTGRLLPIVQRRAKRQVAFDTVSAHLRVAAASGRDARTDFLLADGHCLPFDDASFSTALLVRVFHLTPRPQRLLAELRRVLTPEGSLVISYYPDSRLRSLQHGLWGHLRERHASRNPTDSASAAARAGSASGSRRGPARQIEAMLRDSGFRIEERIGTGLEELSVADRLPAAFFLGLTRNLPEMAGYPTWFARLRAR
jgi:ubiquinone/menaquinone biosynthesis C-methylase UbiE